MGEQKQVKTKEIGPQGTEAGQMLQLLQQLASQANVDLGDLSQIASGDISPTVGDRRLVEESTGAAFDIARRQAETTSEDAKRQLEETLLARGMDDSTIAAVSEAILGRQYQRQMADITSQQQGQSAQALMALPFQRANTQISANQAILQRILGGSQGVLNYDVQSRLGETTSTIRSPFDWTSLAESAARGAAAFSSGGTSEVPSMPAS